MTSRFQAYTGQYTRVWIAHSLKMSIRLLSEIKKGIADANLDSRRFKFITLMILFFEILHCNLRIDNLVAGKPLPFVIHRILEAFYANLKLFIRNIPNAFCINRYSIFKPYEFSLNLLGPDLCLLLVAVMLGLLHCIPCWRSNNLDLYSLYEN